jgi:hypothetical protein
MVIQRNTFIALLAMFGPDRLLKVADYAESLVYELIETEWLLLRGVFLYNLEIVILDLLFCGYF